MSLEEEIKNLTKAVINLTLEISNLKIHETNNESLETKDTAENVFENETLEDARRITKELAVSLLESDKSLEQYFVEIIKGLGAETLMGLDKFKLGLFYSSLKRLQNDK